MRVRTIPIVSPWSTLAARVVLIVALLVSLAACSPSRGYSSGYGGMASPEAPMSDGAVASGGYRGDFEYAKDAREEAPPAPPADTSTTSIGNVTQTLPEPAPDQPAPEAASRKVIYTATMQLSVYELDEAMTFAEALPERYGGWVQSRYENQITVRVPADRLHDAMTELAALGVVLNKTLQASDVTAEYTDLESRLIVLAQMEAQLLALLEQAKTVEDSLKIRQELERVRIELELARARMRTLSELIGFSTLTLHLVQRGPINPEIGSNDPFPWVDELGVEATEYR